MGALVRLPVNNAVNQVFGANPTQNLPWNDPTIQQFGNYQPYGHDGVDFLSPMNTPVYAAGSGTLDFAGHAVNMPRHVALKWGFFTDPAMNWGGGIITMIDHGGFGTFYAHKNRSDWDHRVGQHVSAGALLGLTGNTGRSGGPHLHWSVVDFPLNYSDPLYSRRNPFDYITGEWFDKVDGGKGSPSTPKPKEDTLSAAEVKQINDYTAALLLNGYTSGGEQKPSLRAILSENQRRITASNADIGALRSVVDQIAKSQGVAIDYAKVEEAAATGAARALASGVDIEATVTLNADTAKESKS